METGGMGRTGSDEETGRKAARTDDRRTSGHEVGARIKVAPAAGETAVAEGGGCVRRRERSERRTRSSAARSGTGAQAARHGADRP